MRFWIESWKKCLVFSGRTSRKEFWTYFALNLIIGLSFSSWFFIFNIWRMDDGIAFAGIAFVVYCVITLLPFLSSAVRRLHDVGKESWNVLLPLIPVIGVVFLFFLLSRKGAESANAYGLPCE